METVVIPVHDIDQRHGAIQVEQIVPRPAPVNNSVHRHAFHELFLFRTGSGVHMIDLIQHPIHTPCIHLVAPGQVHKLDRSADMEGAVVLFAERPSDLVWHDHRMRGLLRPGSHSARLQLDVATSAHADQLIGQIANETRDPSSLSMDIAGSYLAILLLKCLQWSGAGAVSPTAGHGDHVSRFLELVEIHFREMKQVSAYAEKLSVSPGHLNALVKERTGNNASHVIQERLLLEAKRLLLHSDLTVKEVSFALKMEDPAYFNRMFRKATGCTPIAFRASVREKYRDPDVPSIA